MATKSLSPILKPHVFLGIPLNLSIFYLISISLSFFLYYMIWPHVPLLRVDSTSYMSVARDLSTDLELDDIAIRAIGYPLLISLSGASDAPTTALYFVQLLLHFLAILLAVITLYKIRVPQVFLYLFIFVNLMPFMILPTTRVLSDAPAGSILCIGIMYWALWFQEKKYSYKYYLLLAGILLAYVGLIRPSYQFASIIFALTLFILLKLGFRLSKKKVFHSVIILLICNAIIIGGYSIYNLVKYDYLGLTPLMGFNLSTKTWRFIEHIPDKYATEREILLYHRDKLLLDPENQHSAEMYIWGAISDLESKLNLEYVPLSKHMMKINLELILDNPVDYVKEVFRSVSMFWFPTTDYDDWPFMVSVFVAIFHGSMIWLFILAQVAVYGCATIILTLRSDTRKAFLNKLSESLSTKFVLLSVINSIIFYNMVVCIVVEVGNPRYRISTDILLLVNVFVAIDILLNIRNSFNKQLDAADV